MRRSRRFTSAMAYKVRYTPGALSDLDRIFEYIAPENPRAALAVKARIRERIESLAQFPASGPETAERGLRMLPVGRYPTLFFTKSMKRRSPSTSFTSTTPPESAEPAPGPLVSLREARRNDTKSMLS